MSDQWILVDGYSAMHSWKRFATRKAQAMTLQQRREELVKVLRQFADHSGRRVTVVFDGYAAKHKPEVVEPSPGVEVIFSERGKTADDTIERMVAEAENGRRIQVVTSDNVERRTVEAMGAESISAELFEAEVESALRDLAGAVRHHSRRRATGTIREHWARKTDRTRGG
ncbi:MAG TPA: NYN domain-containing protein [Verrucomicrobiae bacterium]|nr:NYN domain-containing protein [Verrucomicrobiae bacterium]